MARWNEDNANRRWNAFYLDGLDRGNVSFKYCINTLQLLHVQSNHLICCLQLIKRTVCRTAQPKYRTTATKSIPNHMEREHEPKSVHEDGLHNRQVSVASIYVPNLFCVPNSLFPIYVEASV